MPTHILDEFDRLQKHLQRLATKQKDTSGLSVLVEQAAQLRQKLATQSDENMQADGSPQVSNAPGSPEGDLIKQQIEGETHTSEHTNLQLALIRERTLLRSMINLIPVNIFAKDIHSRFLASNITVARGMGATAEQLLGKTDFDFFPHEMAQAFFDDEQAIIKSGQPLLDREEAVLDRTTGMMRTFLTSKMPFRDSSGNIIGTVGIGRDITEQRQIEHKQQQLQQQLLNEMQERERIAIELRLAQKLESIGRLAAGVAHEINTPIQFVNDSLHFLGSAFDDLNKLLNSYHDAVVNLKAGASLDNGLQGVAAALAATDLDFLRTEIPQALARTLDGANRISNIVRAIKEFSHPDANEQSTADINRALSTTLTLAVNEYKYVATIVTHFGELPAVTCNISELNQVFLNLIVNAAHAIQDAGRDSATGVISVSTATTDKAVEITIGDNGCGIPREHLDKIYDPFFTTKEVGRGTGQGLSIAHSIVVEKHGGTIHVNSTVGEGTQFILSLPIVGCIGTTTEALA